MWDKLKTRLLSAIVLIAILLAVVFFATDWVFSIVVSAITFMIMAELTKVMRLETKPGIVVTNYTFAAIFMALGILNIELQREFVYMLIVLFVMTLGAFTVLDNSRIKLSDVCASVFLVTYSVVFLMHLSFIRQLENGVAFLFMPVIGAYITDTGAYFTGLSIGKHKLIPSVSPNKTVEGAIGGIVAAVIGFVIYGVVMSAMGFSVNYLLLVILAVICAVAAQFGDLTASVIKRNYSVKDFGHLIPGHGGMVDRVDSLMFTAPIVYYFITFLPVIR
jgi:phosphatidate cytidylyltransferase